MSDSPNVALVRRLYDSGMAPDMVAEVIDPEIVWDITPGFPYGGVHRTRASVGADFFSHLTPGFLSFDAVGDGRLTHLVQAADSHVARLAANG
ncbi:hypothetical protein [Streptomyces justiciae]|uniref:hypothetical protein n=1 Tax=Streptomyces justiciae TaxID=2780140 RepID=UPI002117DE5F|nr:hypothetical protein [Streptomyces justiciae]MCW8378331.1 hypothetical protein [Streptomyces justiciae]